MSSVDLTVILLFLFLIYRQLLNAWEAYLPWDAQQLFLQFLPPMRTNYSTLFEHNVREWRRFSKDGTKLGAYSEVSFL